ncbi:MAG TPA: hypothetical protein VGJ44_28075, partial [Kribbellaceae bacterium]
ADRTSKELGLSGLVLAPGAGAYELTGGTTYTLRLVAVGNSSCTADPKAFDGELSYVLVGTTS